LIDLERFSVSKERNIGDSYFIKLQDFQNPFVEAKKLNDNLFLIIFF